MSLFCFVFNEISFLSVIAVAKRKKSNTQQVNMLLDFTDSALLSEGNSVTFISLVCHNVPEK